MALKCHHEVTDLEPSDRYPDPPAPKLLAGYHLIRQNGCVGCPMPANFPPSGQSLDPIRFPGNSVAQFDAMTDLLLNYDWYLKRRGPVGKVLEERSE